MHITVFSTALHNIKAMNDPFMPKYFIRLKVKKVKMVAVTTKSRNFAKTSDNVIDNNQLTYNT